MPTFKLTETDKYKGFDGAMHKALKAAFQNSAIERMIRLNRTDLTNNSGGSADAEGDLVAVVVPTADFFSGATDKAPKAGFDTAIAAIYDGHITIAEWVNAARATLGLDNVVYTGSPTVSGTIAAITSSLTAVTGGTSCVDDATGIAQIQNAVRNQAALAHGLNECLNAIGSDVLIRDANVVPFTAYLMAASAATATGVAGTTSGAAGSLSDAQVDTALGALRDGIATMASVINSKLGGITVTGNALKGVYIG